MNKKVGAVILAAGYGSLRMNGDGRPFPKILEKVGGEALIVRSIRVAIRAGARPVVVVLNPLFRRDVMAEIAKSGLLKWCVFAAQSDRFGTAHGVELAMPTLKGARVSDFLVLYSDMPLWRSRTVKSLIRLHMRERPELSMVSISLSAAHPAEVERYGRIVRDERGRVVRIFEVGDPHPPGLTWGSVNPSFWIWNLACFGRHSKMVEPIPHRDGRQAERHLPVLVGIIHDHGGRIASMSLEDADEALGVNTAFELERVRKVIKDRSWWHEAIRLAW